MIRLPINSPEPMFAGLRDEELNGLEEEEGGITELELGTELLLDRATELELGTELLLMLPTTATLRVGGGKSISLAI
jgi:hypothetical protein